MMQDIIGTSWTWHSAQLLALILAILAIAVLATFLRR